MWSLLLGLAQARVFLDVDETLALVEQGAALVDARIAATWRDGHLPGSGPVSWLDLRQGPLRNGWLTRDVKRLAAAFESAGVRDDRPVVVVGLARDGWGEEGRMFWTLEVLGHEDVHILDGGLGAWTRSGRDLTQTPRPGGGSFTPDWRPQRHADTDRVEQARTQGDALIWDTRTAEEFAGATPAGEARGGHIPGAKSLWWKELIDDQGELLPEAELQARLAAAGITDGQPVITLCTGGVRAGFGYAVLRELGYEQPMVYDGSMWAWADEPQLPVEEGA
jgi:thiosulfate/3-mercaptopyruvate sulfurtransferase